MRIDRRLLGWGAFFIIAGAIPLAVRAGYLSRDALVGWASLWPLFLIGAGLGLVLRRTPAHLLGGAISVLTAGVMIGGLLAVGFNGFPAFGGCGAGTNATAFPDRTGSLSDHGSMQVEFNCGTLDIHTASQDGWSFSGKGPSDQAPVVSADSASVRFNHPNDTFFRVGNPASTWHVVVPQAKAIALSVTLNAGDGTLNLDGANIDDLSLTLNAGSLTANLQAATAASDVSATVNAGSAALTLPASVKSAHLTLNAGSVKVCVPDATAMTISWGGALASNNFDSLGLVKVDDNHWTTAGLATTGHVIDLNVSANAGSFNLEFGGTCNA